MEDFVSFETAKKLKEKGFSCEMPFAMYNEIARLHLLTTAVPFCVCDSGFKYREYYVYEDFDENDYIAPTISQVLKWLRENKKIHVEIDIMKAYPEAKLTYWGYNIVLIDKYEVYHFEWNSNSFEQAALAGIEYVLDNLI